MLENKNGRSFIYRLSPEAADIIIGAGDIFQVRVSVESLSRIPILLSYLSRVPRFLGPNGQDKSRAIVIERKNTEVAPNSLIPFPSLSWPLFGVLVVPSTRRGGEDPSQWPFV